SIKERSPEVHLFLEMAPDAVDVNVHPTKAEVRFREQSLVHEVVRRALMDALGQGGVPQLQLRPEIAAAPQPSNASLPGVVASGVYPNRWLPNNEVQKVPGVHEVLEVLGARRAEPVEPREPHEPREPLIKPMIPLGQFRDTFIIAVDDEGIAIIDQHVAHE